jgi:hypothetical protein
MSFDPRLGSPDPTTRKGFIITGLVGDKREPYLNSAEFHATIHLLADVMIEIADRAAKSAEDSEHYKHLMLNKRFEETIRKTNKQE